MMNSRTLRDWKDGSESRLGVLIYSLSGEGWGEDSTLKGSPLEAATA